MTEQVFTNFSNQKFELINVNSFCSIFHLITLFMKLPWFCHINSGQLFCNCPLFAIAIVPGLFGRKPAKTCCHSVVASLCLGNFIMFLKTNLGYLSQITLKTCNYWYKFLTFLF